MSSAESAVDRDVLEAVMAMGIIQRTQRGIVRGRTYGDLDPGLIEKLAAVLVGHVPDATSVLLTDATPMDAVLSYVVGKQLQLRTVVMVDTEGVATVQGRFPNDYTAASFVTAVVDVPWTVDEFHGVCEAAGVKPLSFVALVDLMAHPDPRVISQLRLSPSI